MWRGGRRRRSGWRRRGGVDTRAGVTFTAWSLEDCLSGKAGPGVTRQIDHVFSEPPCTVALPKLTVGRFFLERMQVRELPAAASWHSAGYQAFATPLFIIRNAVVHSAAGIVALGDALLDETLIHTSPSVNRYERDGRSVRLHAQYRALPGRHVSLLAGGTESYFHVVMESVARLAVVEDAHIQGVESHLVPAGAPNLLGLLGLAASRPARVVEVGNHEAFVIEELVLPWTIHGQSTYHPCIKPFFARMADTVRAPSLGLPRRVYISRTLAANRRLVNESALIDALAALGFVSVNLETLDVETQIHIVRAADVIVAPHGAGLANIVFARPHAVVVELLMDSYVNWCFRHLAAMLNLKYDCVVGRSMGTWSDLSPAIHGDAWLVSIPHVVAAVAQAAGALGGR